MINLIVNFIVIYGLFIENQLPWQSLSSSSSLEMNPDISTIELKQGKYLENFLKNFCEIYSQVLWIFNLIYQYYYGPMIGQLMAKKPFMIVYSSRKHSSIIMIIIFITIIAIFIGEFHDDKFNDADSIRKFLFVNFIAFCLDQSYTFPLFVHTYVKYATIQRLKSFQIDHQIILKRQRKTTIRSQRPKNQQQQQQTIIFEQIRQLALLNKTFARLLSPLLLSSLIAYNLDIITIFYWYQTDLQFISYLIWSFIAWCYLLHLILMDHDIDRILRTIIETMIDGDRFHCCGHCYSPNNNRKKFHFKIKSSLKTSLFCSHNICCHEFYQLYRHDFHLKLYELSLIDCKFLLDFCVFILTFIILSLQT